jgi:hypothetical protein
MANYRGSSSSTLTQAVNAGALALAVKTATVATSGALTVKVTCSGSPCSATLKLTTRVKKTTGKRKRKKTKTTIVTIGSASLSALPVGAHNVSLKLNKTGVRLLKQAHTLHSTATATYTSGSTTKTVSFAVTLNGAKPKKNKKK